MTISWVILSGKINVYKYKIFFGTIYLYSIKIVKSKIFDEKYNDKVNKDLERQ